MNETKNRIIDYCQKAFLLLICIAILLSAISNSTKDLTVSGKIEEHEQTITEKQSEITKAKSKIRVLRSEIATIEVKIGEMGGEIKKKL